MSDEVKIVLEDVKEKFDLVIEAVNGVSERLDHHEAAQEERIQRIEDRLTVLQKGLNNHEAAQEKSLKRIEDGLATLQRDFSDHRQNTELHVPKRRKRAS